MNLVNQLQKTARKNYQSQLAEANEALDSIKENLLMEDANDINLLKHFGTNRVMSEQTNNIKTINKMIAGEFVTRDDIRSICLSYNLRFLDSRLYKKEIPLRVLNDLRNFQKENNISDDNLSHKLNVIAPKSHFSLGKRPQKDPILIFQYGDSFKVVSKWGNDFNFLRRISGFFASNWIWLIITSILFLANSLFTYLVVTTENIGGEIFLANFLLLIILGFIFEGPEWSVETLRTKWDQEYE